MDRTRGARSSVWKHPRRRRAFVEAFLGSAELRGAEYSLISRELRAIVNGEDLAALTRPILPI
jgi:hypothetical protein